MAKSAINIATSNWLLLIFNRSSLQFLLIFSALAVAVLWKQYWTDINCQMRSRDLVFNYIPVTLLHSFSHVNMFLDSAYQNKIMLQNLKTS